MATFGAISDPSPNVLFNPMAIDQAVLGQQRNALLLEQSRTQMANTAEDRLIAAGDRDHAEVARISAGLMGLPADQRPTTYASMVREAQGRGMLRAAPTAYPGDEIVQARALSGLTPAQSLARQDLERQRTALTGPGGLLGGGAPAGGAPASVPGAASAAAPVDGGWRATGVSVPADLMPHFAAASQATGIPVPVLIAQAQQESGFRHDARGTAGEIGIGQIKPSTARAPGFGVAPIDPAQLADPAANIMFQAQYLAGRGKAAGVTDWSNPQQVATALTAYNGGGDPNYVANVTRYLQPSGGAPAPQPTPPGGVAARTGGTNVAGPGAGSGGEQPNAQGLLPSQVQRLRGLLASGATPEEVGRIGETMIQHNRSQATADRTFTATQGTRDDARAHQQRVEERAAETARRAALGNPGVGNRFNDNGEVEPIPRPAGSPAPPPMAGTSIEAQDENTLLTGDTASRGYQAAYARQSASRVLPDGSTITPNMDAYEKPTFRQGGSTAPVVTEPTKMNADQGRAASYADRIADAIPLIEANEAELTSRWQQAKAGVPVVGNSLVSTGFQQGSQAERAFINSTLRRESGAVISDSEFASARKQYIPQPGDDPETLKTKKEARQRMLEGMQREAGPAYKPPARADAAPGTRPPLSTFGN